MKKLRCLNVNPLDGNTIAPPLVLNETYNVIAIHDCSCGQRHYDVGLTSKINFVSCYKCKNVLPEKSSIDTKLKPGIIVHWCHPSRFEELPNIQ